MRTYLKFLFDNPFFAVAFIFYGIPFWVPLIAILFGADYILMLLFSLVIILSKSYLQAEITASNHLNTMFQNLLSKPAASAAKFFIFLLIIGFLVLYAMNGGDLDKGIAAVMIVYVIKLFYFRSARTIYWSVKGLKVYRFYDLFGRLFAGLIWLVLLSVDLSIADSFSLGLVAIFTSWFTFFKTNEGLL